MVRERGSAKSPVTKRQKTLHSTGVTIVQFHKITILLGILLFVSHVKYRIDCWNVAANNDNAGVYCVFPNGDIAKQFCDDPTNEGTENCVLGHVPKK